jgi:hypothetical protein
LVAIDNYRTIQYVFIHEVDIGINRFIDFEPSCIIKKGAAMTIFHKV